MKVGRVRLISILQTFKWTSHSLCATDADKEVTLDNLEEYVRQAVGFYTNRFDRDLMI